MIDKLIIGVVISLIVLITPFLYKEGKRKRIECIKEGKIYYGFFRMVTLYFLALISGELLLLVFLGNSAIDDTVALILTFIASIPITILYLYLYKKKFLKIIEQNRKEGK